jgi:hypothetical protein
MSLLSIACPIPDMSLGMWDEFYERIRIDLIQHG